MYNQFLQIPYKLTSKNKIVVLMKKFKMWIKVQIQIQLLNRLKKFKLIRYQDLKLITNIICLLLKKKKHFQNKTLKNKAQIKPIYMNLRWKIIVKILWEQILKLKTSKFPLSNWIKSGKFKKFKLPLFLSKIIKDWNNN